MFFSRMNSAASIFLLAFSALLTQGYAFTLHPQLKSTHNLSIQTNILLKRQGRCTSCLKMTDIVDQSSSKIVDKNSIAFVEGCTIQTTKSIKAFQVAASGRGSFDGSTFVPLEETDDTPRNDKCLIMPVGFRGTVTRVYDVDEFDANHPIIAKFMKGDAMGGEFEPPITFLMHFDENEVEVVE